MHLHERIAKQIRRFVDAKDLHDFEEQFTELVDARDRLLAERNVPAIRLLAIEFARQDLAMVDIEEELLREIVAAHEAPLEKILREEHSANRYRNELKQDIEFMRDEAVARLESGVKLPTAAKIENANKKAEARRKWMASMKATHVAYTKLKKRSFKIEADVGQLKVSLRAIKGRIAVAYRPPAGLAYGESATPAQMRENWADRYLQHIDWRLHDKELLAERAAQAKSDGAAASTGIAAAIAMADSFEPLPRK